MKKIKNLLYVSELSLPNESAQAVQTIKMCSAFSKYTNTDFSLFNTNISFQKLKKKYLIKNNFKLIPVFRSPKKLNLFNKLNYFFLIKKIIKKKKYDYIFTRSIIVSIFLSLWGYKNILELHLPNTGFTKFFFKFYKTIFNNKYQKFILITKYLNSYFNLPSKKFIVLETGVDLDDFGINTKMYSNSCVYTGSFYKGKGFENIYELAKRLPKINFYAYGNARYLNMQFKKKIPKNLKIFNHVSYSKIPKIISKHKICLLPYSNKVHVKSNSITAEKVMSPIKLVEYLASKKIIIASKLKVYAHILKDKENCFLININNLDDWSKKINFTLRNYNKLYKMRSNASITAKKFEINYRAKKILDFFE
tara:strand:+ start:10 stop:1101 length:1092 start_codon:yes stop_codon:yes gene_type:complete